MANKLFGTADRTLVSAAFKHGASNIPMNLGSVYKQREENVKNFATEINKVFDKIYADDKATNDLLADVTAKSLNIMETGGPVNDFDFKLHHSTVNGFKDRLKSITSEYGMGKGGDLERSKLRNDMNTYLANAQKEEELYTNMVTLSSNNLLLGEVGDQRKELLAKIVEDQNNGTNNVKREIIKGQKYYTLPGTNVKMTMQEISDGLYKKDMGLVSDFEKIFFDVQADGKRKGGQLTTDDLLRLQNKIQTRLTSWSQIINVAQEKFGNQKYTFEEVLTGRATDANGNIDTSLLGNIYDELEKLGGADLDNDGDIDETDKSLLAQARKDGRVYADAQNGFTLIDAIKKDKQLYRDVMANYMAETAAKDFYGQGVEEFKPKGGTGGSDGPLFTPNTWIKLGEEGKSVSAADAEGIVNAIKTGTSFPFMGNQYDYVNGGWYENYEDGDNEESDNYYGSPEMLRLNILKTTDKRFTNLTTEKENKVDAATGKDIVEEQKTPQKLLTEIFQEKEETGEGKLQALFPSGWTVKQQGGDWLGMDSVAVYDDEDNFVGSFGLDWSSPASAKRTANAFYKKFGPEGSNVLKMNNTNIIGGNTIDKADELINKYSPKGG